MTDNENSYTVEKILRRELRGQEIFYKIKWEGYTGTTWEPEKNLDNCDELLSEFKKKMVSEILNVREVEGRLEYLFKPRDNMPCFVVPAMVAIDQWPSLVFDFLENHVYIWKNPNQAGVSFGIDESNDTIGDPIRLTYVTDVSSELQYWFEWPLQKGKFIEKTEAVEKWPRLVYDYLVSNLHWSDSDDGTPKFFGHTRVTRTKSRMIVSKGFDIVAKVRVERHINYDKVLLNKRSKSIARRRTFTAVSAPKLQSILKRKSMISLPINSAIASSYTASPSTTLPPTASKSTASAILIRHTYTPPTTPIATSQRATTSVSIQGNLSNNTTASAILDRRTYSSPVRSLPEGPTPQEQ